MEDNLKENESPEQKNEEEQKEAVLADQEEADSADQEEADSADQEDENFADMLESYGAKIRDDISIGDKIDGKIISIGENQVYIDTGSKSDGVVDKDELKNDKDEFPYKEGDSVTLFVVSLNESEIILSKALSGAGSVSMLEDASYGRTPVEGKVASVIKGGFNVEIMGKRAFCPISQIDIKYVEVPEDYVGKTFNFIITLFAEGGRNIVVSRRDLLEVELKETREQFFRKVSEGDIVKGRVIKLMPYGAFVEIAPGVDGMVHISELSWSRLETPQEAVSVDDIVNVKILKIEKKQGSDVYKISLSMKHTSADPWDLAENTIHEGDQLTGRVMRLAPFGAFVELSPGVDGLVHLSEMSYTKRVLKAEDVVSQGEMVQVVVKSVDPEKKRISLSMKDAHGDPWTGASEKYQPGLLIDGTMLKKEKFGIFIEIEPGITGLIPASAIGKSSKASVFNSLKPGDTAVVMVEKTDEAQRRITLVPPDLKEGDDWKNFAKSATGSANHTMGNMGSILMDALKKKK